MISDQGNFKVTMKRLALCYPDVLGQSSKSQLCGSIGSLIIFKESQFANCCDFPEADRECVGPWSVKWVVVVPGTVADFLRTKYVRRLLYCRIIVEARRLSQKEQQTTK